MEQQLATTPQEFQTAVNKLRVLIAADKKMYDEHKTALRPWYPNEWGVVAEVLKARTHWYRGEILRAKHNIARYMRGEDVVPVRRVAENIAEDVTYEILELQNSIAGWVKVGEQYKDETVRKAANKLAVELIEMDIDILKRTKNMLERYTYGG